MNIQLVAVNGQTRGTVLTKAAVRAGERLQLPNKTLSNILGLSEATISRMKSGDYILDEGKKAYELAALFVRLYRALDAIVGDDAVAAKWLKQENLALKDAPYNMIQKLPGLINVIQYLDTRRAII